MSHHILLQSGFACATDGCKIHFIIHGSHTDSSVMIFQHGYTNSTLAWVDVLPYFLPKKYACVLIDGRGCGLSGKTCDGGSFSVQQYTDDVISVADHLGIKKFTYVGHSMGGGVGMLLGASTQYAARLEHLVLVTPIPSDGLKDPMGAHDIAREERKKLSHAQYSVIKRAAYVRKEFVDATPEVWRQTVERDLACPDAYYDNSWSSMLAFNCTEALKTIHTPTLMVAGSCDGLCEANIKDYFRLPNASLHVFSRASHYPHREEPADFAKVVLDFIIHGPTNSVKLFQSITATRKALEAERS